jgi:serine/threonine-protein kinase
MAKKKGGLRPQLRRFFSFITSKNTGDIVTESEIVAATEWEPATITAHRSKNAFDPFLNALGAGKYVVRRNGSSISEAEIGKAFTQIREAAFVISAPEKLKGVHGSYELVSELGRGAVAHVWKVRKVVGGTAHAAKIVNPRADLLDPSTFDNVKRRFSREARNGSKIAHENIVSYVDTGEYKAHPFLVMELADESLATRLAIKALTVPESFYVIKCCAKGLEHLRGEGCVHRDVKPHNILRFGDRYVVGDLGIVSWSDMNPAFTSAATITRATVQLGSWYYMSPEQQTDPHEATAKSDVYSLGISWIEMLTGVTHSPAAIAAQAFPDACWMSWLNEMIRRMVRFNPADRPTMAEVLASVEKFSAEVPDPASE